MTLWDPLWLIILTPLLGSAVCGVLHALSLRARRSGGAEPGRLAPLVACGAIGVSLLVSIVGFAKLWGADASARVIESSTWRWIDAGAFPIDLSLWFDPLASVMCLVITFIGLLIHVYSVGYMKGDPGFAKFFAYLNLFVAAMLVLVLSRNLVGLFVGWEGVGLCSYLLIGFWYEKGWPAEAGQKAFVMNRIGDACFLIGSFLLVDLFASLDMQAIVAGASANPDVGGKLTLAALLLFGGACGKSAQFPLFTWLPDAMAGPTPVSALIHAATMVTAGIYLLVRLNPVFAASPEVLFVVGGVGALTALIGASTALMQRDIKGVLAYSTVSQLGYMFLALGSGAFGAAVFHLVTHACFKGLLFLGAGSVIHGMHEEQDMTRMGGLRKHMPRTFLAMVIGAAALSGLPGLSGYFSKDEILAHTFANGGFHYAFWAVGLVSAALTAFYSWRLISLTFFGEERFDVDAVHPHESPPVMTVPLMVLAVLAVTAGVLGLPPVLHVAHGLSTWLAPVTEPGRAILAAHGEHHLSHTAEWILLGLGAGIALLFAHRGFHTYTSGAGADDAAAERRPQLARFLQDAWTLDSSYARLIVAPVKLGAFLLSTVVDQFVIDGAVNGAATTTRQVAGRVRTWTDGSVKSYALWMTAGSAALFCLWVWS